MDYQGRRVKIHREEMESLLNLKSKLDLEAAAETFGLNAPEEPLPVQWQAPRQIREDFRKIQHWPMVAIGK